MRRNGRTAKNTDDVTTLSPGPGSAWLLGLCTGVVVFGGAIWLPFSTWVERADSGAWLRRTVEQMAANIAIDGWPMIAAAMAALALVVTIVAFVGTAKWTVMSGPKRAPLADAAWALTALATSISTFVATGVLLSIVPVVGITEMASDIGADAEALRGVFEGLGTQSRLILLGMIGGGILWACRYADRALSAWIRTDKDDSVRELRDLQERLRNRETQRQRALRRRGAEWTTARRDQIVAVLFTAAVATVDVAVGVGLILLVRGVVGIRSDVPGLLIAMAAFTTLQCLIVGLAVHEWRKAVWATPRAETFELRWWQRPNARRVAVFIAACIVPVLVALALITADGLDGWASAVTLAIILAVLMTPVCIMTAYQGACSWDDIAVRSAIRELTAGIAADRLRIEALSRGD